jgi:hypothetical protein
VEAHRSAFSPRRALTTEDVVEIFLKDPADYNAWRGPVTEYLNAGNDLGSLLANLPPERRGMIRRFAASLKHDRK